MNRFKTILVPALSVLIFIPFHAHGAVIWTGGDSSSNLWSATANWSGDTLPTTNDEVTFNNLSVSHLSNVCDISLLRILQINVTNPSAAVTVDGSFTLGSSSIYGGGLNLASATQNLTVNGNVTIRSTQDWNVASGRTLTVNAALLQTTSSEKSLRKLGSGKAVIGGTSANADAVILYLYAGTVELNKTSDSSIYATAGVTWVASGATLRLSGSGGNQISDVGTTSAPGILGMYGTFDLNGRSEGFDQLGGTGTVTNNGSSASCLALGTNNGNIACNCVLTDGVSTLALEKTGTGTFAANNNNSYTGGFTLSGGSISVGTITARGTNSIFGKNGVITLSNKGSSSLLEFTDSAATTDRLFAVASSNGNYIKISGGSLTLTGTVVGNADNAVLTKTGTGNLILSGTGSNAGLLLDVETASVKLAKTGTDACAVAGLTYIASAATVQLTGTSGNLIGTGDHGYYGEVRLGGGTLDMNGKSEAWDRLSGKGTVTNTLAGSTSYITIGDSGGTSTFAGCIQNGSGIIGLVKTGSGAFTLNSAQTYTGSTTIENGTLELTGNASLASATTLTMKEAGTLLLSGGTHTFSTLTGGGDVNITAGVLSIIGPLELDSLNIATGAAGSLGSSSNTASCSASNVIVKEGGVLTLSGGDYIFSTLTGSGKVIINAGSLCVTDAVSNISISGGDGASVTFGTSYSPAPAPVPEPSETALALGGLFVIAFRWIQRKAQR